MKPNANAPKSHRPLQNSKKDSFRTQSKGHPRILGASLFKGFGFGCLRCFAERLEMK